jgi:hypothetical protein
MSYYLEYGESNTGYTGIYLCNSEGTGTRLTQGKVYGVITPVRKYSMGLSEIEHVIETFKKAKRELVKETKKGAIK